MPLAVKTLNHQNTLAAECRHVGVRYGQAIRTHDLQTQPLVFYRGGQIDLAVAHQAQGELEDVRGRRGVQGQILLTRMPE